MGCALQGSDVNAETRREILMGNVWVCCPSARPVDEVNARMDKWRAMGYKVALWRDIPMANQAAWKLGGLGVVSGINDDSFEVTAHGSGLALFPVHDLLMSGSRYPGYYVAVNAIIKAVFAADSSCDWVVCIGDDTDPDPTKTADEIARECTDYLFRKHERECPGCNVDASLIATFGAMQPTGDRWGANEPWAIAMHPDSPAYIDRICGSPWIGRELARRLNQGNGPWWSEYFHMFADEEFQNVAQALGLLWQRRDLTHYHDHCRRDGVARTPEFLQEAYSQEHWEKYKRIFSARKAAGFPGSECIA